MKTPPTKLYNRSELREARPYVNLHGQEALVLVYGEQGENCGKKTRESPHHHLASVLRLEQSSIPR
jgi:hypothetical protein